MRGLFCSTVPPVLSMYECGATLWGLLAAAWPAQFHNPPPRWICQPPLCHKSSPPRLPVSTPPTGLDECSLSPWLSDCHTVRFSVSSGSFLFLNCCCPSFGCVRKQVCLPTPPSWLEAPKFLFIYFLERGEGREKERERNSNVWLPLTRPILGTWPATQCALTGN